MRLSHETLKSIKKENLRCILAYPLSLKHPLAELNQCVLNPAYGFAVNVIDVL